MSTVSSPTCGTSGPILTLFIQNSRHFLSKLLSSIYSTFTYTTPYLHIHTWDTFLHIHIYIYSFLHLQHTYMKCFSFTHIISFFQIIMKFLPIVFTFYFPCLLPFPSLPLLFLFHSYLTSFSQNPDPVCCQSRERGEKQPPKGSTQNVAEHNFPNLFLWFCGLPFL